MEIDNLLKKFRKRLILIAIVKSFLFSLVISFFLTGLIAVLALILKINLNLTLILSLGIGFLCLLLGIPLIYFCFFRVTDKKVVQKLDGLGLEERAITMYEQRNSKADFVSLQRADAQSKLKSISSKQLKFAIPFSLIAMVICSFIFASSFVTVSAFSSVSNQDTTGPDSDKNSSDNSDFEVEYFTITYHVLDEKTGYIDGQSSQKVKKGGRSETVTAIANEGFEFSAWLDENRHPLANQENPHSEFNIRENLNIYAYFVEKSHSTQDPDSELPDEDNKDVEPDNDNNKEDNNGDNSGNQNDNDSDDKQSGDITDSGNVNNNVIDGTQDYQENFNREQFEDDLEKDNSIPDDLKDLLSDYYETLKP